MEPLISTDQTEALSLRDAALPRLLDAVLEINPQLVPRLLEAVQHLPILSSGPNFSIKENIRGQAQGRDVVLKICKQSVSPQTQNPFTKRQFERFIQELRVLTFSPILVHDNLVTLESLQLGILSSEPLEICPALCIEHAPYGNLESFQQKHPHVDWTSRKSLCFDVATGLEALHKHGILHGDVKPSHVLIFDHPERKFIAKLCGFGSSIIDATSDDVVKIKGSSPFRAPEVEEGSIEVSDLLKTDVFSLGLLIWIILIHGDAFSVFDLPLDETMRNEHLKRIFTMPYFYRFIPLLIEHSIGFLEDDELSMLDHLFSRTVRVTPGKRDLDVALEILRPHSRRRTEKYDRQIPNPREKLTVRRLQHQDQKTVLHPKQVSQNFAQVSSM
jgi:serine/threonine protein kinase